MMEQFWDYEAAQISDVLHDGIAVTYWKMVDEANGSGRGMMLLYPPAKDVRAAGNARVRSASHHR